MSASKVVESMRLWFRSLPPPGVAVALCNNGAAIARTGAPPRWHDAAPGMALQRLHAEMAQPADQVGWLTSLQKDVEDQSIRVQLRLDQAKRDLAAGQDGACRVPCAQAIRAIREQVAVLERRQRTLGERRLQAARHLQEALHRLAGMQCGSSAGSLMEAPVAPQSH